MAKTPQISQLDIANVNHALRQLDQKVTASSSSSTTKVIQSVGQQGPQGEQGPPGPQGPAGTGATDSTIFTAYAGENINSLRVVKKNVDGYLYYANQAQRADGDNIIGVSLQSVLSGAILDVKMVGEHTDGSWNWNDGYIFFTGLGILTQTPPTTGLSVVIGQATGAASMLVNVQRPIWKG